MRRTVIVAALAAGIGAAGCSSTRPIVIDLRYHAWTEAAPSAHTTPCLVGISSVDDERS